MVWMSVFLCGGCVAIFFSTGRSNLFTRTHTLALALTFLLCVVAAEPVWAGVGGSISGTVTDASGALITRATVTATNADTGLHQTATTDAKGFYSFTSLPVGRYDLEIAAQSFQSYRRTSVTVNANSALTIDAVLQVGQLSDVVTVTANPIQVETASTQMGEVITGTQMTAVPLNGRSFTDLLALQPGVAPETAITSETVQDVGASALSPSGDLNPGTVSINGQREFSNAFIVNGSDAEEDVNMGAAIVPNLDSIAEFRILTSNFDAEYGEFSGGQINVVTKSGSNRLHGDLFEFARNTNLDARTSSRPLAAPSTRISSAARLAAPSAATKFSSSAITRARARRRASTRGKYPCRRIKIAAAT